jgi:hypothetical protein
MAMRPAHSHSTGSGSTISALCTTSRLPPFADRMRLVNENAKHAVGGLTSPYRQAFQDMIENDRFFLSELESIKQELNSN